MKKLILIFAVLICAITASNAQVDKTTKNGTSVIIPSLNTFKTLIGNDIATFKNIMTSNGYRVDSDFSDTSEIAFSNGLDGYVEYCANIYLYRIKDGRIRCIVPNDMVYPSGAIMDLMSQLYGCFQLTTSDGYDTYLIGSTVIALRTQQSSLNIVAAIKKQ